MISRALAVLAAAAVAAAALLALAVPAAAATDAYVRLAHLSPDTPQVDVYVTSAADPSASFVVPGVGYGAVSPYRPLPAGTYVVSMRKAGAAPDSPAVISTSVDARAGAAYTVAGSGPASGLKLSVLTDRLAPPPAGKAAVRVVNGAASAPTVDVGPAGGPTWVSGVAFATATDYVEQPLGAWPLQVTTSGRPPVTLPVTLDANSVYTVLLLDAGGSFRAQLIHDSAGTGTVPVGSVETGEGGTAPGPALPLGTAGAALVLVLGATLVAGVGRARSR